MDKVKISIHSKVEQDGEFDEYESFADAVLKSRGNLSTLEYQELMGPGQTAHSKLVLHREPARAVLKRTGAIKAVFIFDEKLTTTCLYHAGEISLSLDIQTDEVRLEEEGGMLSGVHLRYRIFSGAALISSHDMRIELEYPKTPLKSSGEDDII